MLLGIIRLIVGWLLKSVWGAADSWYQREQRDRGNRKIILEDAKEVIRAAKEKDYTIDANPESTVDSILRLRKLAGIKQHTQRSNLPPKPLFRTVGFAKGGVEEGVAGESSGVSSAESGSS